MTNEWWIILGMGVVILVLWATTIYRSIVVDTAIRKRIIEGQRRAQEFRKQHEEYRRSIAEEAARLDEAGILVPSVKARLIAQGIYG